MKEYNNIELELKAALNEIKHGESKVTTEKKRLINDIKNGLGSEIKNNPNKVVIIKQNLTLEYRLDEEQHKLLNEDLWGRTNSVSLNFTYVGEPFEVEVEGIVVRFVK